MKKLFFCICLSAPLIFSSCKKDNTTYGIDQISDTDPAMAHKLGDNPNALNLGSLSNYLFVFTSGTSDADWQGASKGFVGNVAANLIIAHERSSGQVPYAGNIYCTDSLPGQWQNIINSNPDQSSVQRLTTTTSTGLAADLANAFAQINAMPVTPGFESVTPQSLDSLNTVNGVAETIVINVTSGFQVTTAIHITGDANDVFILRWDTDANSSNGYQGIVKFQSGGCIIPGGALKPTNFVHVAGDINASGGGSNPPAPYPQGPRLNDGLGSLIMNGADFNGGGFFTGYWLTTGDPVTHQTQSLSNAIFIGGWYSTTSKFSMTSGTSGVYVTPPTTLIH